MQRLLSFKLIIQSQTPFTPEVTEWSTFCKVLFQHCSHHVLEVNHGKQQANQYVLQEPEDSVSQLR